MGDPCHPGGGGVCSGFHGFWLCSAPQHFTAALLPLRPQTTPKIPVGCTQDTPREKLLLRHPCHTELMQTHTERQQGGRGGGRKENTAAHIKLARESQVPPPPNPPLPSQAADPMHSNIPQNLILVHFKL